MSKITVLRDIQKKKQGGLILETSPKEAIAVLRKGNQKKYINQSPKSCVDEMTIKDDEHMIEPHIILDLERSVTFLSGESGGGKTLLSSIFLQQYLNRYKSRKAYYVCATNKDHDINLAPIKNLVQLPTENIDEITIEEIKDTIVLIDDTDFHPDHKKIMKFLNMIVETGRKFGCSLIYSSHIHSKLSESPIYKEVKLYVTFPDSLQNNRMLSTHLKIPEPIIQSLLPQDCAFIAFNKIYRSIITDKMVFKY